MKILITADWHIGKKLHNEDLSDDLKLFFEWLIDLIKEQGIHYLLVAGDIFDTNNPSNESTKVYYSFLKKLSAINCKAIIIAGNHDSPSFIDVPKDLLHAFEIAVVGTFPGIDSVEEIFFPLKDASGNEVAVVAAIPFLQDRFIRQVGEGEGAKEIAEKIKQGMKKLFAQIGGALAEKYPSIPKIGMAHLHAQGTEISEAERDIQIGNQEGITSGDLNQFDYLALGHIHTGQTVLKGKIQYASSPISLGFSENKYKHKVVKLEIENNEIKESEIYIPKKRSLYQIAGTMIEVETQIKSLQHKYTLQTLLDIKIEEESFNPTISDRLETLNKELMEEGIKKIINTRILFKDKLSERFSATYNPNEINALNPSEVLKTLIANKDVEEQKKLLEIFEVISADALQSKK
jgi:exonuclease SbcD